MDSRPSRRSVLAATSSLGLSPLAQALNVFVPNGDPEPIVISSSNGNSFKNGGKTTCVEEAYNRIVQGEDVLDSIIAGVNIVELDPAETSVGYGGLPNAHGVVQLDSCCMHGSKRLAGGVAALEGVKTPSQVASAVARLTDHHLIVGAGAQDFAKTLGFDILPDLNTERSRKLWLEWKRRTDPDHYIDPKQREGGGLDLALESMIAEGLIDPIHAYGTIHCSAIDRHGDMASVTTTSGLAFKIPGRVGDSPILGAGLYLDNSVGASGSTGRGESNLYNCTCFLIVEELRRGAHPQDAARAAMKRVRQTAEKRLIGENGIPKIGMEYYVLDAKGRSAGISTNKGSRFALCDKNGSRFVDCLYAWE